MLRTARAAGWAGLPHWSGPPAKGVNVSGKGRPPASHAPPALEAMGRGPAAQGGEAVGTGRFGALRMGIAPGCRGELLTQGAPENSGSSSAEIQRDSPHFSALLLGLFPRPSAPSRHLGPGPGVPLSEEACPHLTPSPQLPWAACLRGALRTGEWEAGLWVRWGVEFHQGWIWPRACLWRAEPCLGWGQSGLRPLIGMRLCAG